MRCAGRAEGAGVSDVPRGGKRASRWRGENEWGGGQQVLGGSGTCGSSSIRMRTVSWILLRPVLDSRTRE